MTRSLLWLALWTMAIGSTGFLLGVLCGAGLTDVRWCRAVMRAQEEFPPGLRVYDEDDREALRHAMHEAVVRRGPEGAWRWN